MFERNFAHKVVEHGQFFLIIPLQIKITIALNTIFDSEKNLVGSLM